MRVVGLLAWFDENPDWLRDAVASARVLCDDVVALDGAYDGFPCDSRSSDEGQYDAIWDAGGRPFSGREWADQMEKRTELFALGRGHGADWFFVFDADDVVTSIPFDVRRRLEAAVEDVAVFTYGNDRYHRGMFRNLPGLRVEDAHYHYVAEKNGRIVHLRGNNAIHQLEPFANLTDLRVRHRRDDRSPERKAAIAEYRRLVSENAVEATTPEQWAAVA